MQMIQRVLAGTAERENEHGLEKNGRMRNVDEGRIGIKLPPLNANLVKVHKKLATVKNGTKDMKNMHKDSLSRPSVEFQSSRSNATPI